MPSDGGVLGVPGGGGIVIDTVLLAYDVPNHSGVPPMADTALSLYDVPSRGGVLADI